MRRNLVAMLGGVVPGSDLVLVMEVVSVVGREANKTEGDELEGEYVELSWSRSPFINVLEAKLPSSSFRAFVKVVVMIRSLVVSILSHRGRSVVML